MAARALAGGRYTDARELYRQALADAPDKVSLHYGLGVASSHLDRRDDAVREFRSVVQYGPQTASEVAAARQWLTRAGALPTTSLHTAATPSRSARSGSPAMPASKAEPSSPKRAGAQAHGSLAALPGSGGLH